MYGFDRTMATFIDLSLISDSEEEDLFILESEGDEEYDPLLQAPASQETEPFEAPYDDLSDADYEGATDVEVDVHVPDLPVSDDESEALQHDDTAPPEDPAPVATSASLEAPLFEGREPSFRTFRLFPGGALRAYTPRKRVRLPGVSIRPMGQGASSSTPAPTPVETADSTPADPAVPEEPAEEAPAPEDEPPRKLLRRSQARKRAYLPSLAGDLAYSDEESDEEAMTLGGASGRPLFTERAAIVSHDAQLVSLRGRVRELEDQVLEAEHGRAAAEVGRAEAMHRVEVLEQRVAELDSRMRAAVAALAAAFPSSSR